MNRKKELMLKGWMSENGLNVNGCNGNALKVVESIFRLMKRHEQQCENACNGYGVVKGQVYYNGVIDDYARRTYGYNVKSAYISDDLTVFDNQIDKIEDEINNKCSSIGIDVEYQHDPRGLTVKLCRKTKVNENGVLTRHLTLIY